MSKKILKKLGPFVSDPLKAVLSTLPYEGEFRLLRAMTTDHEDVAINLAAGGNLKNIRKNFKISQQIMGKLLRVHQSAVSRIEKGEQTLSPLQFWIIESVFKVPYHEMIQEGRIERLSSKSKEEPEEENEEEQGIRAVDRI